MNTVRLPVGSIPTTGEHEVANATFTKIRVLMADTNQLNSRLLVRELQGDPKLHIESCPGKSHDCIERLSISPADVLLWVANTPCGPTKTIDTIPELLRRFPKLRIILVIEALNKEQIVNAFRAGVCGLFSVEHGSIKGLIKCIHSVYEGQVWANNAQIICLVESARMSRYVRARDAKGADLLTSKQLQTVGLIAEGLGNREISLRLGVSENTVKKSINRIFDKLGVSNRVELVLYALAGESSGIRCDATATLPGRESAETVASAEAYPNTRA
jgi:DNA-binding NarL/FixJ family response regulator